MTAVHVCAPQATTTRRVLRCHTCKKRRRFRADAYEWYDTTFTCCHCGDAWTGGERMGRPFCPGWREKSAAYAKRAWTPEPAEGST